MSESSPPKASFVRVVVINLTVLLILFVGRAPADAPKGVLMAALLIQALFNIMMAADSSNNRAAHLLSAMLLVIIGLGQCEVHLGTH